MRIAIDLDDDLGMWFQDLSSSTGQNTSQLVTAALWHWRKQAEDMGVAALLTGLKRHDPRTPEQQMVEVIRLINRVQAKLEFVGFKYLATKPMAEQGICDCEFDRTRLLGEMVDTGVLVTNTVENKRIGGDRVTTLELNMDNRLVQQTLNLGD